MDWTSGGKGALAGAGTGAAIGSIVPGIGTGIGAGVGAVGGFLLNGGFGDAQSALGYGNPYSGVALPNPQQANVAGPVNIDPNGYNANYGGVNNAIAQLQQYAQGPGVTPNLAASQGDATQQQALINYLSGQATGTGGPSAANLQLQQGLDQSLAQGRSVAQSVAASNPIAALQAAGGAQSLLQRQTMGAAAQLRAQEQLNAQQQLGGVLSQKRYGDVTDTSQQMQADLANRQNQLGAYGQMLQGSQNLAQLQQQGNQAYQNAYVQAQQYHNNQDLQNQQWYSQALQDAQMAQRQMAVSSNAAQLNAQRQFWSTIMQTGGTLGGAYLSYNRGAGGAAAPGSQAAVDNYTTQQANLSVPDNAPTVAEFSAAPGAS